MSNQTANPDNPCLQHQEDSTAALIPGCEQPSGLFNDDIEGVIKENSVYYSALLTQWSTANDMTAQISAQRNNINNFYMSLLSLLIGGLLLSDKVAADTPVSRSVFLVVILILAVCCCTTWIRQIEKCKQINYQKFQIIAQLEQRLPANVMSWEGKIKPADGGKKDNSRSKKNLSDFEKRLAQTFCGAIFMIVVIMLLEMWWTPLCQWIR